MDVITALTSGALHEKARRERPDCVDSVGNIHCTPERARFVDWAREHGTDHPEYVERYVPRTYA